MAHIQTEGQNGHVVDNHELRDMENGGDHYKDEPNGNHHPHHHLDNLLHHHHHHKTRRLPKGIIAAGDSGRRGFNPLHFLRICARSSSHVSMAVNILWPFVPAAIATYYTLDHSAQAKTIFALNFIAMVPTANLIGFAGQELARKLPIVFGMYFQYAVVI